VQKFELSKIRSKYVFEEYEGSTSSIGRSFLILENFYLNVIIVSWRPILDIPAFTRAQTARTER